MKRSAVNSGFLPPKEEKPTLMVGSLGRSPVQSSVGGEAELAALLGPVLGKGLGQLGQREPVGFLAVDQGFDDVGGQGRQLEDAGHIRAIDVEGTGKLADGLDLAGFEDVGPGKGPSQRLKDGGLHRFLRSGDFSIRGLGSDDPLADACRQQEIGTPRFGRPTGDWDLIHGELVTFTDPLRDLPPIDRLEGFRPGGHSMYQRVMVAVLVNRKPCAAWICDGSPTRPRLSGKRTEWIWTGTSFG